MYLFVEDDEQLDKALEVRARLPRLRKIIVFDMEGLRDFDDPQVMSLDALRELGREHDAAHPRRCASARRASRKPDDLAILIYTSGTTGKPKGAMHLARGIWSTRVRGYNDVDRASDENDERMCFLPLCHVAERVGGDYIARLHRHACSTSSRTPRRCRRTCARSRRPCSAPCRASGRSSIRA